VLFLGSNFFILFTKEKKNVTRKKITRGEVDLVTVEPKG
jgi:hypothetical protein